MKSRALSRAGFVRLALWLVAVASCTTETTGFLPNDVDAQIGVGGADGGARLDGRGGSGGAGGTRTDASVDAPLDRPSGPDGPVGVCTPGIKKELGAGCACAAECDSGFCADGVCCNLACAGACLSCNQTGSMGECSPVAEGQSDPKGLCQKESPESCGQDGLCNGVGGCSSYSPGAICKQASCSGGSLVPASSCDGNGTCIAGSPINCSPSLCADGACQLTCVTSADCAPPNSCTNGSCGRRGNGQPCMQADQCRSGFCADGVCCESACTGKCSSCGLPSALGRCVAVPAGTPDPRPAAGVTDPARICVDQGSGSCGTNGRCDGSGGCQRYAAGTVCRGEGCNASTNEYTGAGTCRNGSCDVPQPRRCAPYRCSGKRCASSCSSNAQCTSNNTCINGSCGRKPTGSICSRDTECLTGECEQGVCCATVCTASCRACNMPGSVGTCATVPAGGMDPAGQCQNQGATSCGNDGTCNGSGSCRKYGPSTVCAAQKCVNGVKTSASQCSGTGTCVEGSAVPCSPYVCNTQATDCFNSCSGTGDAPQCQAPNKCNDGKCGAAGQGQDCSVTADCKSGLFCVQGVCCNSSCSGGCKSCKTAGFLGTCKNLAAGASDPACPIDATNVCGNTGVCDGSGSCVKGSSSTLCKAAVCTSTSGGTQDANCTGSGTCATPAPLDCGNNRCENGQCQSCTDNDDCLNDKACDMSTGTCGSKNADGVGCTMDTQCASNVCEDSICCSRDCGVCEKCVAGACVGVANGMSDDSCSDTSVCGKTGKCEGGQCETVPAGEVCGATCSGDSTVEAVCMSQTCSGSGATMACPNNFTCLPGSGGAPATCATSCNNNTNAGCKSGKVCVGGNSCKNCDPSDDEGCQSNEVCESDMCVTKVALGGSCSESSECVSGGHCVLSRCCPTDCTNETGQVCGERGCNSSGVCQYESSATVCDASCSGDATTLIQNKCDGAGACDPTPIMTSCADDNKVCAANACVGI